MIDKRLFGLLNLEQLQQKWKPGLRPQLRDNNEIELSGDTAFA